jgi:glycerol-3-phosphate acyltransferase PlsY
MFGEYIIVQKLLASILVGYLLGSVPFAHIAARMKGANIFATGSSMAGTANVFWNIDRRIGVVVLVSDVAKGAIAVTIAALMDIEGLWILAAGGAAIIGHWKSIFTGFRGGDGMATLLGITLTLVPSLALLGIAVGFLTVLTFWRSPFRSDFGIAASFILMVFLSQYYDVDRSIVLGLGVLGALVLSRSSFTRRRRLRIPLLVHAEMEVEGEPETLLRQATSENN